MTPKHTIAANLFDEVLKSEPRSIRPQQSNWHQAVGVLVHRGAAEFAEQRTASATDLARYVTEWVNEQARDTRVFGNLSKARAQVTGSICVYLKRYAPGPDAQFIGSEIAYDVDGEGGRIDLAWFVPDLGIVVDELKTQAWTNLAVDNRLLAQSQRHRRFGVAEWNDLFVGVRFLPLRYPSEARLINPDGTVTALAESRANLITKDAA